MVDSQNAMVPNGQKLPVGDTFSATFRTFRRAPFKLIGLLLIPLPFSLATGAMQVFAMRSKDGTMAAATFAIILVQYILVVIVQSASIFGASRLYQGDTLRVGESLGVGVKRFLPVVGAILLAALIYIVGGLLLSIPSIIVAVLMGALPSLKVLLVVVAVVLEILLVLIPSIILGLVVYVAVPACVIERIGPLTCLRRGQALTKDNRWRVFGAILLIVFVPILILYAIAGVLVLAKLTVVGFIVLVVGGLLLGAVISCFPAVLFLNLKGIKEGVAPGRMTHVFE